MMKLILKLKPGITDPASIKFRNENELLVAAEESEKVYIEKVLPEKIKFNLEYAVKANLFRDFVIIIKAILHLQ